VQAAVVVPVDPAHGGVFDVVNVRKRAGMERVSLADRFGFE